MSCARVLIGVFYLPNSPVSGWRGGGGDIDGRRRQIEKYDGFLQDGKKLKASQDVGGVWVGIYYPPEVRRGKYWGLGVFLLQYFPLVNILKYCIIIA